MAEVETYRSITVQEFATLDFKKATLVDLREPDELIVDGIEGALNIPFSQYATRLDEIPKDRPVVVYCRVGDWSEQVAEILADRGYEVSHVIGGYKAYREWKAQNGTNGAAHGGADDPAAGVSASAGEAAAPVFIDAKGLKCPGPVVKAADTIRGLADGQEVLIEATEDAFFSDIQVWAERTGNELLSIERGDGTIRARLKKRVPKAADGVPASAGNDKTFVIFNGDLDKTIAAFIMANGAASMGRKVTLFFTFWGLNILRRPEKVNVAKGFVERMFGAMMPRGTRKLGLSRMNMGGMGAKMIRSIMKEKGVSSLEELIESARAHGVRLVACQMSMDIMGIRREELIDGVELGGVATFLGSGETSDMSLFI